MILTWNGKYQSGNSNYQEFQEQRFRQITILCIISSHKWSAPKRVKEALIGENERVYSDIKTGLR